MNDPHFTSDQKSVESNKVENKQKNQKKLKDNESLTVDESDEQVDFMEIFNQYNQLRSQKNDNTKNSSLKLHQNKFDSEYKPQKIISQNDYATELIISQDENFEEDEYGNKSQRFQNMSNSSQLNDSGNLNTQIYKQAENQNIQQSQRIESSTIPNEIGSTQKFNKSKQRVLSKGSKNTMVRPSSATVHGQAGRFIQTQFSKKKLREQSGLFYSQNQLDQVQQSFQHQQTLGSSTQNLVSIGSAQQMVQMVSPQTQILNRGKIQNQIDFEYGNFFHKPVKLNQGIAFLQKKRIRPQSAGINQLQPSKILQSVTHFTYQKAKQNQNQKQFLPESFKHTDKETLYEDKIYLKKQVNDLSFENLQLKTQIQNQSNQLKKKDEMVAQVMRQMFNQSNNINQSSLVNIQMQDNQANQIQFTKQSGTNQAMNKKIKLYGNSNNDFLEEFKARELEHRFVSSRPTQNILRPSEMKIKNQNNSQKFQVPQAQNQASQKIQLLNSELANKDSQITNLKSKIRELNEYIFQKEKELSDLRKTLKFTKLKEYEAELALNVQESKRLRHLLEQEMKKPKIDPVLQRNLQQQYLFQQNQIQSLQQSSNQYYQEIEKLTKKLQIQTKKFAKLKEARKSEAEKASRLDKKAQVLQQRINQLEQTKVVPQRKQKTGNEDLEKFQYFQNKIEQQNQFIHNLLIRMQEDALEISPELAQQMQNWQNGFEDPIIGVQELKVEGSQEVIQFQNEATFFNDIVVTIVLSENSVGFEGQNFLQGKSTQLSSGQYLNFSQLKDYLRRIFEISTLEDFKIKLLVNDQSDNQDKLVLVSEDNWDEIRNHATTQGQQGQQVQLLIELLGQDQIDEQPSNYEEDQFDDSQDVVLSQDVKEFKNCIEFEEVKSIFEELQLILQIKKVNRDDCVRYLLHDCRDAKTGKKLKEISISLLIDQIESRIGFPDKDQTIKLARFLVETVNDQGEVEILTNKEFKGQTHAEATKIKRISLQNKLQKYVPEYQIYNGLALTSMLCRLSSIFENYKEDLLQELEDQDYDDLGKASFQEIVKCMKLVGLYPDSFDQEIQSFIKFLAMRHSNSLTEVRYKQFIKAFYEDFIFIEDEKSQWENDLEPIDCYIASSDEGEYEESLNPVYQEDQQEIYSNNEISGDVTDDLEQNELLEKVDEILGQIVSRLPKNNRIRSLTQVMMPNLLPIFDQEQQKNSLIITQEDFIYFILGQQPGQLGLQISEKHIICLLHLLAQEDEGGYMIQNEEQVSSNKFIIFEEFIELIKTFIKKEQIMKQSKAMGINYEILSKESVEFLFQLRSSLMQDSLNRPDTYQNANNTRHQLNDSSADDLDGNQRQNNNKQLSVPAQIRDIFRKVIQEKQIAFSKNLTQANEKANVQIMDFDQMMDILYMKMSINCPSIKAQEELKFLLCLDLKYLEMVLLKKLDKVMQDLDYISIDLLRCAKDKSLELSRQMAVAELRKVRDKQLSNFKNLQAQTAQSNSDQQNVIGVSMSTKQEKKRKRPDDKKQIISKKSGVRQETSEIESQFRQSNQYPEFNNRTQTEVFDSTIQSNKLQTKSGQIRYSIREEENDDLNLSRKKLAKTEGHSNAQSDQHRYREIQQANQNISGKTKLRIEAEDVLENISDLDEQKEMSEDYMKDEDIPIDDDNNEMSSEQFQSLQNDMISMDHSDDNLIQNNYEEESVDEDKNESDKESEDQYEEIDKSDQVEEEYSEEVFDNFFKESTDRQRLEGDTVSYQNKNNSSSFSTNKVSEIRAIKDGQKARIESVSSQPTHSDRFKFNAKDSSIQSANQFF